MGERRSTVALEVTVRGERSNERRGLGDGVDASGSAFVNPRPNLLTRGVAGEALLWGVSDEVDLPKSQTSELNTEQHHEFKGANENAAQY